MTVLSAVQRAPAPPTGESDGCVRVADLAAHKGGIVASQYLLTDERQIRDGNVPHLQVRLADVTGSVSGFIWPDHPLEVVLPRVGSAVEVNASIVEFNGKPQCKVRGLKPLSWQSVSVATDFLLGAPQPSVDALRALETSLPRTLRRFLARVLLDPNIAPEFVFCRASGRYHHCERGGLLQHSVENLDLVATMIERTLPGDDLSVGIGQLGYLLHDVGKIRTVGTTQRPLLSWTVRHEAQSLLLLGPHLEWLRGVDPDAHAALVYVLEYVATPAKARERAKYFPAEAVVMADQCSAASYWHRDVNAFLRHGPRTQPHRRLSTLRSAA